MNISASALISAGVWCCWCRGAEEGGVGREIVTESCVEVVVTGRVFGLGMGSGSKGSGSGSSILDVEGCDLSVLTASMALDTADGTNRFSKKRRKVW